MNKFIEIPATLRLEVPSTLDQADVQRLVDVLTVGDFAVYADSDSASLTDVIKNYLLIDADPSLVRLVESIKADLWASVNSHKISEL
ncbi:hypothetical protein QTV44_002495 [Vibrio vulnificus]|nr:hypothetical protein [Vibrio vulnificus]